MTQVPQSDDKAELLREALIALRELSLRSEDAYDLLDWDEFGIDTWKSSEFSKAVKQAEAILARAASVGFEGFEQAKPHGAVLSARP